MRTALELFSRYKYLVIIIFISWIAGKALLNPGLPPTHDGEYHVIRFYEFDKAIRDGNIYPRWAADLNNTFGVPLFNYVYPFPNYFSSLLHLFAISFIDAFKLNMFFATIVGGILFYLWSRLYWGDIGGVVASTFYTFTPYHFVDIYVRGSVGEVWALAFFPGFLWAITLMFRHNDRKFMILAGTFLALVIFSHNILAEMFFIFGAAYCLFLFFTNKQRKASLLKAIGGFCIGIGLTAVFWLPALLEIRYVRGLQIFDTARNFPELYQLLIPSWGTGFSGGSIDNEMSLQIGIANLLAVLGSFVFLIRSLRSKEKKNVSILVFFLICFICTFFIMLPSSEFIWQYTPFFRYFQFPWRFLSLMMVITSFLAGVFGYMLVETKSWRKLIFAVAACLLSIGLTYSYTLPAYYHMRDDSHYITRENFIHGTNSPGNSFNTVWFTASPSAQLGLHAAVRTTSYQKYFINNDSETTFKTNIAYFPGWSVYINNDQTMSYPDENGKLSFHLPEGKNTVEVHFNDTMIRALAKFVSLVTFITVFVLYVVSAHAI